MPSVLPMRGLRMTDELYLKLRAVAKSENRSYNQEAVYILQKFIVEYEEKHGAIDVNHDALYE